MPDALLRPPDGAFGHVEVVVGVVAESAVAVDPQIAVFGLREAVDRQVVTVGVAVGVTGGGSVGHQMIGGRNVKDGRLGVGVGVGSSVDVGVTLGVGSPVSVGVGVGSSVTVGVTLGVG